jgi:hypothetical protein
MKPIVAYFVPDIFRANLHCQANFLSNSTSIPPIGRVRTDFIIATLLRERECCQRFKHGQRFTKPEDRFPFSIVASPYL